MHEYTDNGSASSNPAVNPSSSAADHRLITLRNGIGNAIHCQSIIIVSLSYDVIDNVLSRDGHEERKTLIAMTVCCYKMIIQMSMSMETVRVVHWRCCLSHLSFFDNLPCRNIS